MATSSPKTKKRFGIRDLRKLSLKELSHTQLRKIESGGVLSCGRAGDECEKLTVASAPAEELSVTISDKSVKRTKILR